MSKIADRLKALGLDLPPPHPPAGVYVGAKITGDQLWVAGVGPTRGRETQHLGWVGSELSLEEAKEAVTLTTLNIFSNAAQALENDLDRITGAAKILLLIRARPDFTDGHLLAAHASDLFGAILGEDRRPAISVTTAPGLPIGIPCEMDAILTLS